MISFPRLLMNREVGLSRAQSNVEQAFEQKTIDNLSKDRFISQTVQLPRRLSYDRIFRCRNYVAVLSAYFAVQKVALWSMDGYKLWTLELSQDYGNANPATCTLSENGMIIIDPPDHSRTVGGILDDSSKGNKIIVVDGKPSGILPSLNRFSITPIGKRIIGSWAEHHNPENRDSGSLPENSNLYFGEFDQEGKLVYRHQLDYTKGRLNSTTTVDENFWVCLSASSRPDLASTIQVVDRVARSIKTFELPLNSNEEKFTSACIVQCRLFYGKTSGRLRSESNKIYYDPVIGIYDLVKGVLLKEYPTKVQKVKLKYLVANEQYAAWLEFTGDHDGCVKYLDISSGEIEEAAVVPYCANEPDVVLNIMGTILSVVYAKGNPGVVGPCWQRKVIDMKTCEVKSDRKYERSSRSKYSMSNGSVLITYPDKIPAQWYIQSFLGPNS